MPTKVDPPALVSFALEVTTEKRLALKILPQPTETTCGPTCLHALYQYYNRRISLHQIVKEIPYLEEGGTLAVMLGNHALKNGFDATIYTYNLHIFDPTWFTQPDYDLRPYLRQQKKAKRNKKLMLATDMYLDFLERGGKIVFADLTTQLLKKFLSNNTPVLTGLSATYLYKSAREIPETNEEDSIAGDPTGHFVVLMGYDRGMKNLMVADPFSKHPFSPGHYYLVDTHRVISSILLGIVSYDANLLVVEPAENE